MKRVSAILGYAGLVILLLRLVWFASSAEPNEHIKAFRNQPVDSSIQHANRIKHIR